MLILCLFLLYGVLVSIGIIFILLTLVIAVFGACLLLYNRSRDCSEKSVLIDEIINASDRGQLLFNENHEFVKCNKLVLINTNAIMGREYGKLTQPEFLNNLYDHAADFDESVKNSIMSQFESSNAPEFREVVYLDDKSLCLVHARKLSNGMTLFTLIDINMGRQREENIKKLNMMNNHLMQAIQSTATGIVISDPKEDGNPILFVNDAFCEFTDSKGEDLLGAGWGALMPMFVDKGERDKYIDTLSNFTPVELELEKIRSDKKYYYTMTFSASYNDDGELDLFIGLLSDVTILKQRESEFFQAQKLESLGQLAAGVAHDFNNILSIIGGYSTMASKLIDDSNEKAQEYLKKIEAASNRGAGLTRKMLTFSRHKIVAKSCIDVRDTVEEQSELLVPLLGVSVDMDVVMPDHEVNIMGSSSSVGQILMNLAINARDAMPEGGKLLVDLCCLDKDDVPSKISSALNSDDYVCLSVSDTGTGMDSKTVDKIFDPFFSTKEQGKGTGLGLSVVYGLVNELGGVMDVVSNIGQGTKFSVYMPRSFEAKTKALSGDLRDIKNIRLDGYTVLIAEDEPDLLNVVKSMLEDLGLNVLTATNGDEALVEQEEHFGDIDILLTDVIMPEMNGVKLAELLTSLRPETQVVFMSGYPANGNMAPVELPQGATFIAKPVDYEKMVHVLYQKLEGSSDSADGVSLPHWETSEEAQGGSV